MKKSTYHFLQLILGCMLFSSCDKYLEIAPKGTTLLTTVEDYDQWLNAQDLVTGVGAPLCALNYLGDNYDLVNITNPATQVGEMIYLWQPQFSPMLNVAPMFWGEHYAKINLYNTVLVGIDNATGGTQSRIRALKAEALLGRAFEYFYLVNEYAQPYDAASASTELAVPFVTSNDVTQTVPPRSTVAEIYNHIMSDIEAALPNLPDDNSRNRFRGSKASAYSVLARLYFYARNYPEAQKHAQLAIDQGRATMINLNGPLPTSNLVSVRSDVIYGRTVPGLPTPTLDFMNTFRSNDRRIRTYYFSRDGYQFITRDATRFMPSDVVPVLGNTNTGTSLPEMKLIVAECAARGGNLELALRHLDEIRRNRFPEDDYEPFVSTDPELVLQEVLLERLHELPFNGLRWFDMRRLKADGRMPTVHRYNAIGEVIATLQPDSERYTLQIPLQVLNYNPNMPQNP